MHHISNSQACIAHAWYQPLTPAAMGRDCNKHACQCIPSWPKADGQALGANLTCTCLVMLRDMANHPFLYVLMIRDKQRVVSLERRMQTWITLSYTVGSLWPQRLRFKCCKVPTSTICCDIATCWNALMQSFWQARRSMLYIVMLSEAGSCHVEMA